MYISVTIDVLLLNFSTGGGRVYIRCYNRKTDILRARKILLGTENECLLSKAGILIQFVTSTKVLFVIIGERTFVF